MVALQADIGLATENRDRWLVARGVTDRPLTVKRFEDIVNLAESAGMQVILDGRIGREEYRSVYGSIQALQRFADALRASVTDGCTAQTLESLSE